VLTRFQLTPTAASDERGERRRRLSNSHGIAGVTERVLDPIARSPGAPPGPIRRWCSVVAGLRDDRRPLPPQIEASDLCRAWCSAAYRGVWALPRGASI
jgi:hypothetical protein